MGRQKALVKSIYSMFYSLSGEASSVGARALFIRCKGCNLRCKYCDTSYAWDIQPVLQTDLKSELPPLLKDKNIRYIILTGGEPLLQFTSYDLQMLCEIGMEYNPNTIIQIETNGSIPIPRTIKRGREQRIQFVMDIKLPSSGMYDKMNFDNLSKLSIFDQVKFVIQDEKDLEVAFDICTRYTIKCRDIWFSPVYGQCDEKWLWNSIVKTNDDRFRVQLQLHKVVFGQVDFEV